MKRGKKKYEKMDKREMKRKKKQEKTRSYAGEIINCQAEKKKRKE